MEIDFDKLKLETEKIIALDNIEIVYPRLQKILNRIKFCHEISKICREPENLFIHGPTGVGKTFAFYNLYLTEHEPEVKPKGIVQPVLSFKVPTNPTVKAFAKAMLRGMGDKNSHLGSDQITITDVLTEQLIRRSVEIIFLDEAQHFRERKKEKKKEKEIIYDVADWFKNLISTTNIPIVMVGLSDFVELFRVNDQLDRRFGNSCGLAPFSWKTDENKGEFIFLLKGIDNLLPFKERAGLEDYDLARRIFFSTNGIIDYVMQLIKRSSIFALITDRPTVDMDLLAMSYEDVMRHRRPNVVENPFTSQTFSMDFAAHNERSKAVAEKTENSQDEKVNYKRRRKKRKSTAVL